MQPTTPSTPQETLWIPTPHGRLYAERWHPSGAPAAQAGGSPFVLFHDSLGSVALWRDFPQQLATTTGRDVIAYDRLGFGQSDAHPDRLLGNFVRAETGAGLQPLREALGLTRFIALGHSVGGGMAVCAAAQHPEDCRGLVTIAAQAFVDDGILAGIREVEQAFAQPGQLERLQKYHGDKAAWVLRAWVDSWCAPWFADWTLDEELPRVQCPLLVIHGEKDEYGCSAHPRRIAEHSRGPATLCLLEGVGHVPHRERPQDVLQQIQQWLQTHAVE